ncbi:MAG: AAA family ATPase [Gemmatimonadetes bacterium]|nr:AAA family ATPase [Gemmatimonadota bacterium]NIY44845.1 AAA family ATPase [Gemmatimonadota bacterium]
MAALGFAVGLGLSVLGAFLLNRNGRRLKDPAQVREQLGLPLLGTVPQLTAAATAVGGSSSPEVLEAFRVIHRNLMHVYGKTEPVVAVVTSPSRGEGKSVACAHLARACACLGRRTLVIDADVGQGNLHRLFGEARRPGLTDCLGGAATRAQAIHSTARRGLDLIGWGSHDADARQLLSSSAMGDLLAEIRRSYDIILIDTAPLDDGRESLALAANTGNLVFVLRAGVSDGESAESMLDLLDRLPVRVLGAVFNDVPRRYGTGEERLVSAWQRAEECDRPPDLDETSVGALLSREVYQPSGDSQARAAVPAEESATEPVEPAPPDEPEERVERAGGSPDHTCAFERDAVRQPDGDVWYDPDWEVRVDSAIPAESEGANGGNGSNSGSGNGSLAAERCQVEDRQDGSGKGNRDGNGNGPEPVPNPINGSGDQLESHAALQLERFRAHQRRNHQRHWR